MRFSLNVRQPYWLSVSSLGVWTLLALTARGDDKTPASAKTRSFRITYAATVTDLSPGKVARIWLPVPPSNREQDVELVAKHLPAEGRIKREPKFGNDILYLEAQADADGKLPLSLTYRVTRREVHGKPKTPAKHEEPLDLFLQADANVPISGKPLELIKDKKLPEDQVAAARVLYDVVNGHMRYSKEGTGWGRGDSVWACTSGYGNCSDFHSLFISLARAKKIPAKFEIGFPLLEKHGSGEISTYHCWARFRPAGGDWVPVDISEANKNPRLKDYYFGNLSENRVSFSTGRDLELVPRQAGKPLNFFIYPYVEVDGKPYPADKIQPNVSFQDLETARGSR
jgi:transglutaminase-like putative cysteine protease